MTRGSTIRNSGGYIHCLNGAMAEAHRLGSARTGIGPGAGSTRPVDSRRCRHDQRAESVSRRHERRTKRRTCLPPAMANDAVLAHAERKADLATTGFGSPEGASFQSCCRFDQENRMDELRSTRRLTAILPTFAPPFTNGRRRFRGQHTFPTERPARTGRHTCRCRSRTGEARPSLREGARVGRPTHGVKRNGRVVRETRRGKRRGAAPNTPPMTVQ